MKCILLCAGYATRLFPLTENFPKALLDIEAGKPLLDYILDEVNTIDIVDEIYLITNAKYYNHFNDWAMKKNNVKKITVINDMTDSNDNRLGAIGDIKYVIDSQKINDDLLIIAGDNLFDYKLKGVVDYYKNKNAVTVCAKQINDINILKGFAVAKLDSDDRILDLEEKPENPKSDIGVYATYLYPKFVINEIVNYLKEGNKPDAPGYLVEYLYKKYPVYAYKFEGNCYDVGTFDSLNLVREKYNKK